MSVAYHTRGGKETDSVSADEDITDWHNTNISPEIFQMEAIGNDRPLLEFALRISSISFE